AWWSKCGEPEPSDHLSELGRNHVGEEVQGARDTFWGDASSYIWFNNEARQTQRLLYSAQAFHNIPGRAEHHAFLQEFLIGQGCQLRGPRRALGAFELLGTAQVALAQAFIVGHYTRAGVGLGLLQGVSHIDREPESHLTLARVASGLPGCLVCSNDRREFGHGSANERHQ